MKINCYNLTCVNFDNYARFRCLEDSVVIPRENPFLCHYPNKHNDSFVIECCKEYDFCNKDLKLSLHIKLSGRILFSNKCMDFLSRIYN